MKNGIVGTDNNDATAASATRVEAHAVIEAPIERVWAEVANFQDVSKWHPDVTESRLLDGASGTKPGDVRAIRLRDGSAVKERLVETDPIAHRYTYSVLDGQLPLTDHLSTLAMRPLEAGRTDVTWTASFHAAGAPAEVLAKGIRTGVLELGLQGLAARATGGLSAPK